MTGRLRLTVDKDRPGHVRAASIEAKGAGIAVLISGADGTVEVSIERPSSDEERQNAEDVKMRRDIVAIVKPKGSGGCTRKYVADEMGIAKPERGLTRQLDWLVSHGQLLEFKVTGERWPRLVVNPDEDQLIWEYQ